MPRYIFLREKEQHLDKNKSEEYISYLVVVGIGFCKIDEVRRESGMPPASLRGRAP